MDEPKYELPPWLPWATTACLAALVACLTELWTIERSRSELFREQGELAESGALALQNQLEAERIVDARQLENLSSGADPKAGLQVILLRAADSGSPASGVAVLEPSSGRGQLRLYGALGQSDTRDFQLWITGHGSAYPARCAVFHADPQIVGSEIPVAISASVAPGCRLVLIDGKKGGNATLQEAMAGGSIVLASPPYTGEISGR